MAYAFTLLFDRQRRCRRRHRISEPLNPTNRRIVYSFDLTRDFLFCVCVFLSLMPPFFFIRCHNRYCCSLEGEHRYFANTGCRCPLRLVIIHHGRNSIRVGLSHSFCIWLAARVHPMYPSTLLPTINDRVNRQTECIFQFISCHSSLSLSLSQSKTPTVPPCPPITK